MVQPPSENLPSPVPQRRLLLRLLAVQDRPAHPPQPRSTLVSPEARRVHPLVEDEAEHAPSVLRERRARVDAALQVGPAEVLGRPVGARPPVDDGPAERGAAVQRGGEHGGRVGEPGEDDGPDGVDGLHGDLGRVRAPEVIDVAGEIARVLQTGERLSLNVVYPVFVGEASHCEQLLKLNDRLALGEIEAGEDASQHARSGGVDVPPLTSFETWEGARGGGAPGPLGNRRDERQGSQRRARRCLSLRTQISPRKLGIAR